MRAAMTPELLGSGLFARLALVMPDVPPRRWTDDEISEHTTRKYSDLIDTLSRFEFAGKDVNGRGVPGYVSLSPDARELFIEFYNRNGEAIDVASENEGAVLSKMEGCAARLALIFHCCRTSHTDSALSDEDLDAGVKVAEWLIDEASRVYRLLAESSPDAEIRTLHQQTIQIANSKNGHLTPSDLHKRNKSRWPSVEAARLSLDSLVSAGLGTWKRSTDGFRGRPTEFFVPKITPLTQQSDETHEDTSKLPEF